MMHFGKHLSILVFAREFKYCNFFTHPTFIEKICSRLKEILYSQGLCKAKQTTSIAWWNSNFLSDIFKPSKPFLPKSLFDALNRIETNLM